MYYVQYVQYVVCMYVKASGDLTSLTVPTEDTPYSGAVLYISRTVCLRRINGTYIRYFVQCSLVRQTGSCNRVGKARHGRARYTGYCTYGA